MNTIISISKIYEKIKICIKDKIKVTAITKFTEVKISTEKEFKK